jgi:predicted dehydrogenase
VGEAIRVGVVGCGLVAQVMHLPHLRDLADRFAVTAVCDIAPGALDHAGRMFPAARRHHRWADVIDDDVDAVLVLTPGSHAPVAVAAAEAGLHVFVEKPMCFSVAEGEEMVRAAERSGTVLMVGYMKRFDPSYEALQHSLDLDAVSFARITTLESPIEPYALHHPLAPPSAPDPELLAELQADDEARLREGLGTDDPFLLRTYRTVLLDSMVHELNGIRGLLGEPTALHSSRIWGAPGGLTLTASFGAIEATFMWVDLPGIARYAQDWSFFGAEHRWALEFPSPLLRSEPTRLIEEGGEPSGVSSWRTEHTISFEEAFKRELEEFHAAITEGRAPRTDGVDGLRDVALCRAIVETHARGGRTDEPTRLVGFEPAP